MSEPPGQSRRRWRKRGYRLLAVLASLLVGTMVLEVAIRLIAPQRMGVPGLESVGGLLVPRANLRGRDYSPGDFDVQVSNNGQRLRGRREYSQVPEKGSFRILTLGDSFTYGVGVSDDETYPAHLERLLSPSGRRVEALNAGIYGSGTSEQVLWYKRWACHFRPHVVVLTVYANDLQDDQARPLFALKGDSLVPLPRERTQDRAHAVRRTTRWLPGYSYLSQHSHLLNLVRSQAGALIRSQGETKAPPKKTEQAPKDDSLRIYGLVLARLLELVREQGAELAVVFVPPRYAVRVPGSEPQRLTRFKDCLVTSTQDLGVPFRDLTPHFIAQRKNGSPLYYDGDFHCTPRGYRVLASGVSQLLGGLSSN